MKTLLAVLIILFLGSSYLLVDNLDGMESIVEIDKNEMVFVSKVIDGDTIVANGEHIRLLGIDADERGYDCYKEAKEQMEKWILLILLLEVRGFLDTSLKQHSISKINHRII